MRKSRLGEAMQQNQGHKARKQRAQLNLIQVYLASKTMYVVVYIILSLPTLYGLKMFSKITMKSLMGAYYAPDSPHIYVNSFHLKNNAEKGCHRIPSIWIRKLRINNLSNHAELRTEKKNESQINFTSGLASLDFFFFFPNTSHLPPFSNLVSHSLFLIMFLRN